MGTSLAATGLVLPNSPAVNLTLIGRIGDGGHVVASVYDAATVASPQNAQLLLLTPIPA